MRRRSLPQVVIPVHCHADWNEMTLIDSRGRTRFCDSCARPVYDSASMTHNELADLIARYEGKRLPCVQLHRRPDGTIVTRDCFAPLRRAGHFLWVKVGLAAVAFWAAALGMRPLARSIRESIQAAEARDREPHAHMGGYIQVVRRSARDELDAAELPPNLLPWGKAPNLGIRALLPEVAPAAPLLHLEADKDVWQRLEPDRHDRLAFMMEP